MKTLLLLSSVAALNAAPFTPENSHEILERLPAGFSQRAEMLRQKNHSPEKALQAAREFFQIAQQTGDAQSLNLAESLLKTSSLPDSKETTLLKAAILQQKHDFQGALQGLNQLLSESPNEVNALILKNSILQNLGFYQEGRRMFMAHPELASDLRGLVLLSTLTSLNGQLDSSYDLLNRAVSSTTNAPARELSWAWTALAEMATRKGDVIAAESHFRRALRFDLPDLYLANAFADFLLNQERWSEALEFIRHSPLREKLKLRQALALKGSGKLAENDPLLHLLSQELGTSPLHTREQAIFYLHLQPDFAKALALAGENWKTQKEPIDAIILLEAALKAKSPEVAAPVLRWIEKNRVEDIRLSALSTKFEGIL